MNDDFYFDEDEGFNEPSDQTNSADEDATNRDDGFYFDEDEGFESDSIDQDSPQESTIESLEKEDPNKMGKGEALLTGLGQGTTFGTSPILAGLGGAAMEGMEDLIEKIPGDWTEDEKLRAQGFKLEDDYEGIDGLIKKYYDVRDYAKKREDKSFKDQPGATLTGNIAGGLAAGGLATKALAGTVSGISGAARGAMSLPKYGEGIGSLANLVDKSKNIPTIVKAAKDIGIPIAQGIGIGAGASGVSSFGQGTSRLLEGEIQETIDEVGTGIKHAVTDPTMLALSALPGLAPAAKWTGKAAKKVVKSVASDATKDLYNTLVKYKVDSVKDLVEIQQRKIKEYIYNIAKSSDEAADEVKSIIKNKSKTGKKIDLTEQLLEEAQEKRAKASKFSGQKRQQLLDEANEFEAQAVSEGERVLKELDVKASEEIEKLQLSEAKRQKEFYPKAEEKLGLDAERKGFNVETITNKDIDLLPEFEGKTDIRNPSAKGVEAKISQRDPVTGELFFDKKKVLKPSTEKTYSKSPKLETDRAYVDIVDESTGATIKRISKNLDNIDEKDLKNMSLEDLVDYVEAWKEVDPIKYSNMINKTERIIEEVADQNASGYSRALKKSKSLKKIKDRFSGENLDELDLYDKSRQISKEAGFEDVSRLKETGVIPKNSQLGKNIDEIGEIQRSIGRERKGISGGVLRFVSETAATGAAKLKGSTPMANIGKTLKSWVPSEINAFVSHLRNTKGGETLANSLQKNIGTRAGIDKAIFLMGQNVAYRKMFEDYEAQKVSSENFINNLNKSPYEE